MPSLTWSDEYCTHIRVIDDDHKNLFEIANALQDAYLKNRGHERISRAIVLLNNYVNDHFDREERFLEQAGFPDIEQHIKLHKKFKDDFQGLRTLYHHDPECIDIEKVVLFISQWLEEHIQGSDMEYVPYVRGEKDGDTSFQAINSDYVRLSLKVPKDTAELIENFIDAVSEHGMTENIEALMKEISDQKITRARSMFT